MVSGIRKRAKALGMCVLLCTVLLSVCTCAAIRTTPKRDSLSKVFCTYIGVKEATGHNDGAQVNAFQAATGNHTGDSWCASFVAYCLKKVGIKSIGNGMARSWFNNKHNVWERTRHGTKNFAMLAGYRGNTGGLYFPSHKAIAHIFFIKDLREDVVITVEGNTNNQLSREGDGCFECKRKIKQIYAVSNWTE